jgi:hypothetical protein
MSDDIVYRLRAVLHNDRSVELMNREAADEIERLREAIAHWSRADQEWLNIDVPTAAAMAKLHEAERALRDAAGLPHPRDRRESAEPDGELE